MNEVVWNNVTVPGNQKAVAYMRCSGLGQIDGDTWDRQIDAIGKYASEHGLELVNFYREEAIPGKYELQNRPALSRLLADLNESDVRTVIVEKLDRLARDVIVQENIIRHFQAHGLELYSANPAEVGLCSEDPTRKFIRVVLGASAQLEKDLIILRTRVARERIRNRGEKCEGRKAFGENGDLAEVRALGVMRKMQAAGKSARGIAEYLNLCGEKTRTGKRWHAGTVAKILKRGK